MLSPRAIRLLLQYFDSIDQVLSRRLVRKRTWDEEALTFLLTELLDTEAQADHNIPYPHNKLLLDLNSIDEPVSIIVELETHSYPKTMERYVTQSDIGLILSYQDQFDHEASFRRGWLLQAKRLFPDRKIGNKTFTANSRFESVENAQHTRMIRLRDWAECDFIRYLLYCPRPSALNKDLKEQLSAARSKAVARDIFDFLMGLELRDDLLSDAPTIAAGIFVAKIDSLPHSLVAVHECIFKGISPFSWFIVTQIAGSYNLRYSGLYMDDPKGSSDGNLNNPIIEALIRGDKSVCAKDLSLAKVLDDPDKAQILPAHTITVRIINGMDRPRSLSIG